MRLGGGGNSRGEKKQGDRESSKPQKPGSVRKGMKRVYMAGSEMDEEGGTIGITGATGGEKHGEMCGKERRSRERGGGGGKKTTR